MEHIKDRFRRDIKDFTETGDMSDDLYDALYDYYFDDMPYAVRKAKSNHEDQYQWISNRFADNLGINENLISPMIMPVSEGSCNMTAEGEYCPEHGLAECYMEEGFLGKLFGTEKKKKAAGELRPYMVYDKFTIYYDPVDHEYVTVGTGEYQNKFEAKPFPADGGLGGAEWYGISKTGGGGVRDPLKVNKEALRPVQPGMQEDGGAVGMPYSMGEGTDDPINSNSAMTGSYYEGKETQTQEGDALLARIKSLALLR
jgi:hypothetical protein